MTAPERFAEKSNSLLHRGRRPYMTYTRVLGPDHPDSVQMVIGLAKLFMDLGRRSDAIELIDQATPVVRQ